MSLTINNASNKHLGKYQCRLSSSHGSVTLDYLLTYEGNIIIKEKESLQTWTADLKPFFFLFTVLSEIVIPPSPKTVLCKSLSRNSLLLLYTAEL